MCENQNITVTHFMRRYKLVSQHSVYIQLQSLQQAQTWGKTYEHSARWAHPPAPVIYDNQTPASWNSTW